MKTLVPVGGLTAYFRELALAGGFVLAITSPTLEIGSTFKSAYELAHISQSHPDFFGIGPHWVDSDSSNEWKEKPSPEVVYSGYAVVFTLIAQLKESGRMIGGYRDLIQGLAGYEILHANNPLDEHGVGHLMVKLPSDPIELEQLKSVLLERSVLFSIDDGSGSMHLGNTFMGNGIYFGLS
ncbi:hypothetical protein [Pseudomonas sp. ICMP 561]|uniref:hypothetical protein n=1 Tax=Pseudomonas sp. ICMP 561 TaxID=1718918 RepID=UPI000C075526|nr:hypothetical protein [Pseudomonas sp. ICMP 561]PHN28924.1 hypothetical protein AO242_25915 [Pseudomonas sp. ICMP 561]